MLLTDGRGRRVASGFWAKGSTARGQGRPQDSWHFVGWCFCYNFANGKKEWNRLLELAAKGVPMMKFRMKNGVTIYLVRETVRTVEIDSQGKPVFKRDAKRRRRRKVV